MNSPIDAVLDQVEWEATGMQPDGTGLPYATHHGILDVLGNRLRCYRLSTGEAVFNVDDVQAFFGATPTHPAQEDRKA